MFLHWRRPSLQAYFILDELLLAGEMQETSKKAVGAGLICTAWKMAVGQPYSSRCMCTEYHRDEGCRPVSESVAGAGAASVICSCLVCLASPSNVHGLLACCFMLQVSRVIEAQDALVEQVRQYRPAYMGNRARVQERHAAMQALAVTCCCNLHALCPQQPPTSLASAPGRSRRATSAAQTT